MVVTVFGGRGSNAELMVDCVELGYLRSGWVTVDVSFGLGRFWRLWRPDVLFGLDLVTEADVRGDFCCLPFRDGGVDVVVFDPPYKLNGTSTGVGVSSSDVGYGVAGRVSVAERHGLMEAGVVEAARVASRVVLVKCQDQVASGRKWWQTRMCADWAEQAGLMVYDMLHLPGMRKQPSGRVQKHAYQNYSTLLVCVKKGWNRD